MKVNGIKIFVEKIEGNGELNFVLLHNAGGNHQFFIHQVELLKKYGDIIWFDLPGHSKSKETLSSYQMTELASIVNHICKNLTLENICLVGLNNGANIVVETALNQALPIKSLILIDPPLFMAKSFVDEIKMFIDALEGENYNEFISSLADVLFIDTDIQNKNLAKDAFNKVNKKSLQDIFKGLIEWDSQSVGKLKNIPYPTLCILTDEHHCTYNKLKEEAPHFEIGKVIGSKCWATLEVPDQINAMIDRFLKINR